MAKEWLQIKIKQTHLVADVQHYQECAIIGVSFTKCYSLETCWQGMWLSPIYGVPGAQNHTPWMGLPLYEIVRGREGVLLSLYLIVLYLLNCEKVYISLKKGGG